MLVHTVGTCVVDLALRGAWAAHELIERQQESADKNGVQRVAGQIPKRFSQAVCRRVLPPVGQIMSHKHTTPYNATSPLLKTECKQVTEIRVLMNYLAVGPSIYTVHPYRTLRQAPVWCASTVFYFHLLLPLFIVIALLWLSRQFNWYITSMIRINFETVNSSVNRFS